LLVAGKRSWLRIEGDPVPAMSERRMQLTALPATVRSPMVSRLSPEGSPTGGIVPGPVQRLTRNHMVRIALRDEHGQVAEPPGIGDEAGVEGEGAVEDRRAGMPSGVVEHQWAAFGPRPSSSARTPRSSW
jgi:hypothetical protein